MPWNTATCPPSMKHLDRLVRAKAIEVAIALLAKGIDEGKAIRLAIAVAEAWALRRYDAPTRSA